MAPLETKKQLIRNQTKSTKKSQNKNQNNQTSLNHQRNQNNQNNQNNLNKDRFQDQNSLLDQNPRLGQDQSQCRCKCMNSSQENSNHRSFFLRAIFVVFVLFGLLRNIMIVINHEETLRIGGASQNGTLSDWAIDVNPYILIFAMSFILGTLSQGISNLRSYFLKAIYLFIVILGLFGNIMIVINLEETSKYVFASEDGTLPVWAKVVNPRIPVIAMTFISSILMAALLLTTFGPFSVVIKIIFSILRIFKKALFNNPYLWPFSL